MEQNYHNLNKLNQLYEEDLNLNIKKIFITLWNRKNLIIKVFVIVFVLMILSTYIVAKKYEVDADLYINKSNSSNMAEINPYFISEIGTGSGMAAMLAGGGNLTNELELMQSPLVIDKVIKENDLRFKKLFGIIPTVKTGTYLTTDKFLKKKVSFEIKKGTNVVTISYKDKDKELAYGIVNSIITNYIQLHKELNTDKSKSDKAVLQAEYNKAKADLNKKMNSVHGVPANAMTSAGSLTAMSAFSKSAQRALSNIQGQYINGVKSEVALREDAERVAELAKKLEWAKLVDNMSESSNVVILKEPRKLQDYEQTSPKLFTNILLGIVFGAIGSVIAVIFKELTDKKLTYSMLGDEIVYDVKKEFRKMQMKLFADNDKPLLGIMFDKLPDDILLKLKETVNIKFIDFNYSNDFMTQIKTANKIILFAKINETNSEDYKTAKSFISDMKKEIIEEVLL